MSLDLSYSQVEAVLTKLHSIPSAKRLAFQARLKHLQAVRKFPVGINTGSGKRARYTFPSLMQLVLAVELMQAGLTPQLTVKIVLGSWPRLRPSILSAIDDPPDARTWLWAFSPFALRDLSVSGDDKFERIEAMEPVDGNELWARIQSSEATRTVVLHGTKLTRRVVELLIHQGFGTREQVGADLATDLD